MAELIEWKPKETGPKNVGGISGMSLKGTASSMGLRLE